jgi:hypothetical protein
VKPRIVLTRGSFDRPPKRAVFDYSYAVFVQRIEVCKNRADSSDKRSAPFGTTPRGKSNHCGERPIPAKTG